MRFGGQGQLTNLIQLLNYRLDIFLILIFVNTAGVGLYTVAVLADGGPVDHRQLGRHRPADEHHGRRRRQRRAHDAGRLPQHAARDGASAAVGAAVLAPFCIPVVFGSAYQGSVLPYLWLLPGTVALSGAKILAAYVFSRGRPIINAWIALATLLVDHPDRHRAHLACSAWPAPRSGTSLGYCLSLVLTAIAYRRLSGGSILEALVPQLVRRRALRRRRQVDVAAAAADAARGRDSVMATGS